MIQHSSLPIMGSTDFKSDEISCLFENAQELTSLRLSSHQVSLLLSSIWVQATTAENSPANFVAMAHTYNIALLFTRSKVRFCTLCML